MSPPMEDAIQIYSTLTTEHLGLWMEHENIVYSRMRAERVVNS